MRVFESILSSLVGEVDHLYESFQISPLGRDVSQEWIVWRHVCATLVNLSNKIYFYFIQERIPSSFLFWVFMMSVEVWGGSDELGASWILRLIQAGVPLIGHIPSCGASDWSLPLFLGFPYLMMHRYLTHIFILTQIFGPNTSHNSGLKFWLRTYEVDEYFVREDL